MDYRIDTRRTSPLGEVRIKTIAREIAKRARKVSSMVTYAGTDGAFIDFFREEAIPFSELDAFESINVLALTHRFLSDRTSRARFADACRRLGSNRTRMFLRFFGSESESPGRVQSNFDLQLSAGWQTEKQVGTLSIRETAPHCTFLVGGGSPGFRDLGYRRDLFRRAVAAMELSDFVHAEIIDGTLSISANSGWRVIPEQAELGGRNPLGFNLFGFADAGGAIAAGEYVLERIFRELSESAFVTAIEPQEDYEPLRGPLNDLAKGWEYGLLASLSKPAAAILAGKPPKNSRLPRRVPAFWWSESREGATCGFSGELVASDGGYCLNLATDCGEPARLEEYVEVAEDIIKRSA